MMRSQISRFAHMSAGLLLAVATVGVLAPTPAAAVSADCKSDIWKINHTLSPDEYRAGAYCYSVGSDTKVRAKLVRNNGPDKTSVWFTGTYIWRYTGWNPCVFGCWDTFELGER